MSKNQSKVGLPKDMAISTYLPPIKETNHDLRTEKNVNYSVNR
jgi:hypothetical protein